jgi:hypothetical protein
MNLKQETMKLIRKALYYYFFGVLYITSFIVLIILFDYVTKGYWLLPEFGNFIKTVLIGSFGGAMLHYAIINTDKTTI